MTCMHFVQIGYSGLALAPNAPRVYQNTNRDVNERTDMKLIITLKNRISQALRAEPVPCWTEYLHQTAHRS